MDFRAGKVYSDLIVDVKCVGGCVYICNYFFLGFGLVVGVVDLGIVYFFLYYFID